MSKKRKCLMCETEYEYCPYCWEYERQPKWRTLFDRSECQDVYYIISDWLGKRLTQKEAREKLLAMNLKNIPFNSSVQGNIDTYVDAVKTLNGNPMNGKIMLDFTI